MILQIDELAHYSTVVLVPLTTSLKRAHQGGTVFTSAGEAQLRQDSVALCYQIRATDRRKLSHKIGDLPSERLSEIEAEVAWICGIPSQSLLSTHPVRKPPPLDFRVRHAGRGFGRGQSALLVRRAPPEAREQTLADGIGASVSGRLA